MERGDHKGKKKHIPVLAEKLKRFGLRATPQRLAILEFLEGNTSHPSAEEIFRELKPHLPSLSMATVYGTLEVLRKEGEVQELTIDPERKRFDPNPKPHNHFLCRKCGRVYDLPVDLSALTLPADIEGFWVEIFTVDFYGLCPACKK
ncbi:MAG: Fur family transcriptional regulator [Desulfofundulus sp.]|uniref:Fur family transcriptional regulator n=1 Tax=Desulfofundulus sp. TaxID=2282750 RepID=UPI003C713755